MSIEWNGEGLPPVGCECEAKMPQEIGNPWKWRRVKVVAVGEAIAENECLVYDVETSRPAWVDEFRPIRTEAERRRDEQKRDEAIEEMINCSAVLVETTAGLIYDAIAAGKIPHVTLK